MTDKLKLSIITLTSNSAHQITNTVMSINQSEYRNLEVVFKDNCSEDETVQIIKSKCIKKKQS